MKSNLVNLLITRRVRDGEWSNPLEVRIVGKQKIIEGFDPGSE